MIRKFVAHTGEHYQILESDQHFTIQEVGKRSKRVKRAFVVAAHASGALACNGRQCRKQLVPCPHVRMIHTLLERPMPESERPTAQKTTVDTLNSTASINVIPLRPQVPPLVAALTSVRQAVEHLYFQFTVYERTLEGQVTDLIAQATEEYRPRTLHEYMHVFEQHLLLIHRQRLQCRRCMAHYSCVKNDRQGMKCLSYFLTLDAGNELDWFRMIPLTWEALSCVDFPTLLILSALHSVNFDTLDVLTIPSFRQRLLDIAQE